MLPLLPEISLGFLTLWLLIREGIEAMFRESKNILSVQRKTKWIDIIVKVAVVAVFLVGIYYKISATKDEADFNKELLQKLDLIEKQQSKAVRVISPPQTVPPTQPQPA